MFNNFFNNNTSYDSSNVIERKTRKTLTNSNSSKFGDKPLKTSIYHGSTGGLKSSKTTKHPKKRPKPSSSQLLINKNGFRSKSSY